MALVVSQGWRVAGLGVATALAVLPASAQPVSGSAGGPSTDEPEGAQAEEDGLGRARTALDQGRHGEAIRLATGVRSRGPPSSRAEALEVIGTAHALAGRTEEARRAFGELLDMAPAFELADPSAAVPVRAVFEEEAAKRRAKRHRIELVASARDATLFAVEIAGGAPVARVLISCREAGRMAFAPVATSDAAPGETRTIRLRSARAHGCVAVAYDRDDLPIGRAGTRARPVELTPRTPVATAAPGLAAADQPLMTQWWFWALVGGLAAAGALTIAVAAAGPGPEPPAENVGTAQGKLGFPF